MTDKPTLLLIDDEERILRSLAMLFRGSYQVHATVDPHEAIALVERERVHVVVSDQRMPVMRGADLLREVRSRSPNSMRILLTGYSELDAVVSPAPNSADEISAACFTVSRSSWASQGFCTKRKISPSLTGETTASSSE